MGDTPAVAGTGSGGPAGISPIGRIHSPYHDKFGAPRQPGLVPGARGEIELFPPYADPRAVDGLAGFSHLWIVFLAHLIPADGEFHATVRPPRLGGNTRLGVFATRSLFRPNRLGLSLCRLESVHTDPAVRLVVSGLDLVDGTPVLDIKPYIPYSDAVADASAGFAALPPAPLGVIVDPSIEAVLASLEAARPGFRDLLIQTLAADPRPAYHQDTGRVYAMDLAGVTVRFRAAAGGTLRITSLDQNPPPAGEFVTQRG